METTTEKTNLDATNRLLSGEITAYDTYTAALKNIEEPKIREVLEFNCNCHSLRVDKLTAAVEQLGGKPSKGAALWGAFAGLVEGGAAVISDVLAIDMLEEGEDRWLAEYKKVVEKMGSDSMVIDLMNKQQKSHDSLRTLKKSLH